MASGVTALVLGDPKGEYVPVARSAGGQVIRVGRGLDRINPLDAGPLGSTLARMTGPSREAMLAEVRGQRLNALLALCALVRAGRRHPGRGKYLLKAGDRVGIPVEMTLVGDEPALYDTDPGALR